jgi:exopolyphosphatase/guanosine-5'-triphosphate,3'-diphosphate pyrophosphatase
MHVASELHENDINVSRKKDNIVFMNHGTLLAAIDLGSNSFRLEIGRYDHGQIQRIEYLKETVRQGNGLDEDRNLTPEAMERGWACLARFAERLSGFKKAQVRAVATQTLREAKNREAFIQRGCEILGFPIEVIAGTEEARLIYQGVSHMLPHSDERRLVIDIGGRSTELVLGMGTQATETASFHVGSVTWSMTYFPQGEFTEQSFYRAEIAAQAVLEEALSSYPRTQWDTAYGASGTVGAVADILALSGWPEGQVTREGLNWLVKCLLRAGHASNVRMEGLKEDRRAVIGGGVSVLRALMELLEIDTLQVAQGALRHGVLFEMVERDDHNTDTRDVSVQRLAQKFAVDAAQAQRVSKAALTLFDRIAPQDTPHTDKLERKLSWAAQLHEVGMAISHTDYHKHGAYILDNADLLGFGMQELHRLGVLVLGQRGKLKKLEAEFDEPEFVKLLLALRVAIILCHARKEPDHSGLTLRCNDTRQTFVLTADVPWTNRYPQSTHLLRQECAAWERTPWSLQFVNH